MSSLLNTSLFWTTIEQAKSIGYRPYSRGGSIGTALIDEGKSVSEVTRTFNVHVTTIYRCLHDEARLSIRPV